MAIKEFFGLERPLFDVITAKQQVIWVIMLDIPKISKRIQIWQSSVITIDNGLLSLRHAKCFDTQKESLGTESEAECF